MVFAGADGEFARKPLLHAISSRAHSPNPQEPDSRFPNGMHRYAQFICGERVLALSSRTLLSLEINNEMPS